LKIKHTYSIIAISDDHSEMGVAVQSHWFAVGAICPWIIPGVGAITTQSMVEVSYGPKGLELLKNGNNVKQTLELLLADDSERDLRQVAIMNAKGMVATHTGKRCIAEAGHQTGENYSVQANMMLKNTVWQAMASAFEKSNGKLARRLFAALEAAQHEGGDIRGNQSAAMIVADNILDDRPWSHFTTNLRVDDHPQPISELHRLLNVEQAYELMNLGDVLIAKGDFVAAKDHYAKAADLAPDIEELPFWEAVTLTEMGKIEQALPIFRKVFSINRNWILLVKRLPASGLLPKEPEIMEKILSVA
jgi:uncharacterized Ntn-hydrolase superfamily protein